MALRREQLTREQSERQEALDRSWAAAQRLLADGRFRSYLAESMRRLDAAPSALPLTGEEFLALTEPTPQ